MDNFRRYFPFAPSPYQLLGFVLGTLLWIRAKAFWSEQRAVYRFRPALGRLYNRFPWQSVPSDFVRDLVRRRQHTPSPASAALSRLQPPSVEGQGILDRAPFGSARRCLLNVFRKREREKERESGCRLVSTYSPSLKVVDIVVSRDFDAGFLRSLGAEL